MNHERNRRGADHRSRRSHDGSLAALVVSFFPVSHSYLEMPKRTTPILYRDLLEDAAIILGALDKNDGPRTRGMSKERSLFLLCLGLFRLGWFDWKWPRDWPSPGRLGLLARLFFSGHGLI